MATPGGRPQCLHGDELRAVLPRLDAAIAAGEISTEFLVEVWALAVKHADSLRQVLKGIRQGDLRLEFPSDHWRDTGGLLSCSKERADGSIHLGSNFQPER